jgi:hypothetical protein
MVPMTRTVTTHKPRYERRKKPAKAAPVECRIVSLPPSMASVCDRLATRTWMCRGGVQELFKRMMQRP